MSNKRITDLTELTTPTTDDVFPVVDIATNTTTKVQLGNLPVPSSVTTALATKQDSLVSGTNIKTINSTSVLGSGNIAVQPTLVSGTSIKTVNSNSLLGAGDVAVQETLVSGTNIKTLNNTSLLGSGNITLTANPSGVAGAIQFSNGSAFASDASNLFWDDTNKRLGIRTNAPTATTHIRGVDQLSTSTSLLVTDSIGTQILRVHNQSGNSAVVMSSAKIANYEIISGDVLYNTSMRFVPITTGLAINKDYSNPAASTLVHIKGSGSTSATTSLLVQNSAGNAAITVTDDLKVNINSLVFGGNNGYIGINNSPSIDSALRRIRTDLGTSILSISTGEVGVGDTTTYASAIFAIGSTTRGFLPPRMTTTQKNAIASPAAGLVVYDSTTNKLCCYNGSTWNDLF